MTLVFKPKSFSAFRRPVFAAWLKLLSFRPPTSVTSPTWMGFGVAVADAVADAVGVAVAALFPPPQAATTVAASIKHARARFITYPLLCRASQMTPPARRPDSSAAHRPCCRLMATRYTRRHR